MQISARNLLTNATSVTLGGTSPGTSLTDINVLIQPFVGDVYVTSKGGTIPTAYGQCYAEFDLKGPETIKLLACVPITTDTAFFKLFGTIRDGGSGGTLVWSDVIHSGPYVGFNSFVRVLTAWLDTPVVGDYVRFDWAFNTTTEFKMFRRFWASDVLDLPNAVDAPGFNGETLREVNEYNQPIVQDLGLRREVAFDAQFAGTANSVVPLDVDTTAFAQLARAGLADEVLVRANDDGWTIHGKFVGKPRVSQMNGPRHRVTATVREF
jgi:hypothetical protein